MCYAASTTSNAFNGTSNSINAFTALSRAEPSHYNKAGLSSFQLASLENNKDKFGSSISNMHSYIPSDIYAPPNYENPHTENNGYNSFGSSAPINFFQQQAINQAFQSHMLNPFLSGQSGGFGGSFKRKN
jgi:hypothetical protein